MNLLCGIVMSILIATTSPVSISNERKNSMIDAYIAVYDAIYNDKGLSEGKEYVILDMESYEWIDFSYEDKQKVLEQFKKYNKTVVSSSLVGLKQIGLVDKRNNLKINGVLLMIEKIDFQSKVKIDAIKWVGSLAAQGYSITLDYIDNTWKIIEFKPTWIA